LKKKIILIGATFFVLGIVMVYKFMPRVSDLKGFPPVNRTVPAPQVQDVPQTTPPVGPTVTATPSQPQDVGVQFKGISLQSSDRLIEKAALLKEAELDEKIADLKLKTTEHQAKENYIRKNPARALGEMGGSYSFPAGSPPPPSVPGGNKALEERISGITKMVTMDPVKEAFVQVGEETIVLREGDIYKGVKVASIDSRGVRFENGTLIPMGYRERPVAPERKPSQQSTPSRQDITPPPSIQRPPVSQGYYGPPERGRSEQPYGQ